MNLFLSISMNYHPHTSKFFQTKNYSCETEGNMRIISQRKRKPDKLTLPSFIIKSANFFSYRKQKLRANQRHIYIYLTSGKSSSLLSNMGW